MTRMLTGTGVLQDKIYNYKFIITSIIRGQVHVCNPNTLETEEGGFKTSFSYMLKKHNTSITLKTVAAPQMHTVLICLIKTILILKSSIIKTLI